MDRTLDVDAISLDNINVLFKWRVKFEVLTMEKAPAWLEEEQQQEEQKGEEEKKEQEEEWLEDIMEGDVLASTPPSTQIATPSSTHTSRCLLSDSGSSIVRGVIPHS
jgi:hypothetical protein